MRKAKISKVMIIVLISILLFSTVVNAKEIINVKININGVELKLPEEYGHPFIDNQSRTMIPLRIISERLGHEVDWDNSTRTASIDNKVFITIGKNSVKTPNGNIQMDTVAILKDDGRTYVPLRFVVEALGYEVTYDGPKSSNNYNHIVNIERSEITRSDIFKEGMTTPTQPTEPVKDGNVYKIKTETGVIEVNMDRDVDKYGGIVDEKARELLGAFQKSIKVTETANSVKLVFYQPEMPIEDGLKYKVMLNLWMKEGSGYGAIMSIYDASRTTHPFATFRDDGYVEVNYDIDMSLVESINFWGRVSNNEDGSTEYKADLRTGKIAFGPNEFLYE